MTQTAKERIEEEIKEAELSYKMNDRRSGDYIAGALKGLEIALEHVENVGKPKQPKLSIPKKVAEQADKTDFEELFQWGQEEFYQWFDHEHDEYKEVIYAYLAGKALGVELVEVTDE